MGLAKYRKKRNFRKTSEPRGGGGHASGRLYVIQKHAASRLHYDFRLELQGVLKSWAVPKGPSLDPADKRLAVQVEDHPVEYGSFEGIIPEGEYGGGTVMLWDRGSWEPQGKPLEQLKKGHLRFRLKGDKLQGLWNLVRMHGRKDSADDHENWLLYKANDAVASPDRDVLEELPESVLSHRSMEQIAHERTREWHSSRSKQRRKKKRAAPTGTATPMAEAYEVQLATLVKDPPADSGWLHEIKLDGYRMLARIADTEVSLVTRNGNDWTDRFPRITRALAHLGLDQSVLDGEIVAFDDQGVSSFQTLQNSLSGGADRDLSFVIFDVLYLNGHDTRPLPLVSRKELVAEILAKVKSGPLRYSEHVEGSAADFLRAGCSRALEGIICKRADAPYVAGRTEDWLKVKCMRRQEFVIGGYTDPQGSRYGFGALLLGYHDKAGNLRYAGRVGTGFSGRTLTDLGRRLEELQRKTSPFSTTSADARGRDVHYVDPDLVCEVEFGQWTRDGIIRHSAFQGLREDKPVDEVSRERPQPTPRKKKAQVAGVTISHPDRILYPELGLTKLELAHYYERVAERILPQLAGRAFTVLRCPEGRGGECFFQRHAGGFLPDGIETVEIPAKSGSRTCLVLHDVTGLIGLVQMGALEVHTWGSLAEDIEHPDRIVLDIDPDPALPWKAVKEACKLIRAQMDDLKLISFLKTTGGKGMHVVIPLGARRHTWEEVHDFSSAIARSLAAHDPSRYVAVMSKAKRVRKIFIDYMRNNRSATAVAAYSTRAREGAPVSMPLAWDDLDELKSSQTFTVETAARWLRRKDPWKDYARTRQSLPHTHRRS